MATQSEYWQTMGAEFEKETDLSIFKTWKSVLSVPLYSYNEFFEQYSTDVFSMIEKNQFHKGTDLRELLKESKVGHTEESYKEVMKNCNGIDCSSNTLKNLHHILSYEEISGKNITDYDTIVEFGAGCGELASMIHKLGFEGDYYIHDLPQVARISKYYLTTSLVSDNVSGAGIYIDDVTAVPLVYNDIDSEKNSKILFIGIWSVSETPYEYRDKIADYYKGQDFMFIAQRQIWNYDNFDYFINKFPYVSKTWSRTRAIPWHPGDGGNAYFISSGV
jgi:putative sugar O-methyltransferase